MAAVDISQEDLSSFHATHFSAPVVGHFSHYFLGPVEEEYTEEEWEEEWEEEEEDDGLGWYADGVKRTLTDEQIAIFRHSEIETLLRERRHIVENGGNDTPKSKAETAADEGEIEDGELEESPADTLTPPVNEKMSNKKKSKKQKKRDMAVQKGYFKQTVKPDLRKRTWDKVETGVGNLDYDEMDSGAASAPTQASQRRRISYDDD
ncbi:hypothetical protein G7Y89_g1228 [Cudoniella acicularis]|uniref:Uncharacterized protein n=1 Tax=Cudoniella acicularis TaxID=354080 RepID=A0A8H4RWT1_9HELO|nr:hypothetical protein G7Y89_g1228 [Cudoniella acicularis]